MVSLRKAFEQLSEQKYSLNALKEARKADKVKNPGLFNTRFLRATKNWTILLFVANLVGPTLSGVGSWFGVQEPMVAALPWINSAMYAAAGLCAAGLLNKAADALSFKSLENRYARYEKSLETEKSRAVKRERAAALKRLSRGEHPFPDTPALSASSPTRTPAPENGRA